MLIPIARVGRFDDGGGPVAEDFRHARGNFRGVIAGADDRIRADFRSMLDHDLESIAACFFAHPGPDCDVAADDLLESSSQRGKDIARTDYDSTDDAQVLRDLLSNVEADSDIAALDLAEFKAEDLRISN